MLNLMFTVLVNSLAARYRPWRLCIGIRFLFPWQISQVSYK